MSEGNGTGAHRGLGWRPYWDPRDRNHLMISHLKRDLAGVAVPEEKVWQIGPILDQGEEGACFPAGTLVRMADGSEKAIEDIQTRDVVVTAEGRTGRVFQTMVRHTDDGLLRLKLRGHSQIRCTPDHPILTRRGYVSAKDLLIGDEVALPRYLPESVQELRVDEWVSLAESRGTKRGLLNTGGVLTEVVAPPKTLPLTAEFGRLVGLYLAEGSTTPNKVCWTFGEHEEHTLVEETAGLLEAIFGVRGRLQYRRANHKIVVNLYGKLWRLLFERLFGKGADRCLPAALAGGPQAFLEAVLGGWIDGDGYRRRNTVQGVTTSHTLALNMYDVAQALGKRPTIRRSQPGLRGSARTRRERWDMEMATGGSVGHSSQDSTAVFRKVQAVEYEPFAGDVFNLHVQGDESYVAEGVGVHNCVGYAWRAWMNAKPIANRPERHIQARDIYLQAQLIDEFPGQEPTLSGTTVRAAAKIMVRDGHLAEYAWSGSADEILTWVRTKGPLVFSMYWFDSMTEPDENGYVEPAGRIVGGHALCIYGVETNDDALIQQSWGEDHGLDGCIKMSRETLSYLMSQGYVSACAAAQVPRRSMDE